jgi:hypothetical protein
MLDRYRYHLIVVGFVVGVIGLVVVGTLIKIQIYRGLLCG